MMYRQWRRHAGTQVVLLLDHSLAVWEFVCPPGLHPASFGPVEDLTGMDTAWTLCFLCISDGAQQQFPYSFPSSLHIPKALAPHWLPK